MVKIPLRSAYETPEQAVWKEPSPNATHNVTTVGYCQIPLPTNLSPLFFWGG